MHACARRFTYAHTSTYARSRACTCLQRHMHARLHTHIHTENNSVVTNTFVLLQSVLKNIPVVGSLFGWLVSSPTSGSKGRTFSLQSGICLCIIFDTVKPV